MLRGFLIVLLSLLCARAQNTSVSCSSTYDWMRNNKGQSPCLVAAWLQSPCVGLEPSAYEVRAPTYVGPTNGTACACSTVLYSTLAACAACQGAGLGGIAPWPIFSQHCRSVAVQQYPQAIPNGTSVPAWAYIPLLNSTFNIKAAHYLASLANTPVISATSTTSSNPITLSVSTSAPLPVPSTSSASSVSPPDTVQQARSGHIEGSALVAVMVVSLLGLSVVVAGIIVVIRRKWLPRIQVESPRASTVRMPTPRTPMFWIPTLRIPSPRIPILRMPALRVPALPMPALQLPAWGKRRGQYESYTNTESKLHMFYDPDDPRTFPPSPSPADIYFYRCRQKAAMNLSGSDSRSYTEVTATLGGTLASTVGSTIASSTLPTSPLRGYTFRPEGGV